MSWKNKEEPQVDPLVLKKYRIDEDVGQNGVIGRGSFGTVWRAIRRADRRQRGVALKRCDGVFRSAHDALRIAREVLLLRQLKHPNIVQLQKVLRSSNDRDLYLIFEYCDCSLLTAISQDILGPPHQRHVSAQLIASVRYLHSRTVVHRDIKPANVLLYANNCQLRLADFGEARLLAPGAGEELGEVLEMTLDGSTLWYKAPEMLCRSPSYHLPVDLWACGCVVAEMLFRRPPFPGSSMSDQLKRVCIGVGLPGGDDDVAAMRSDHAAPMLSRLSLPQEGAISRAMAMQGADPLLVDCTVGLLRFNPVERLTAAAAAEHPFLRGEAPLQAAGEGPSVLEWDLPPTSAGLSVSGYRDALYQKCGIDADQETPHASDVSPGSSPVAAALDNQFPAGAGGGNRDPLLKDSAGAETEPQRRAGSQKGGGCCCSVM